MPAEALRTLWVVHKTVDRTLSVLLQFYYSARSEHAKTVSRSSAAFCASCSAAVLFYPRAVSGTGGQIDALDRHGAREHDVLFHLGNELRARLSEADVVVHLPDPCSPLLVLLEEKCAAFTRGEIRSVSTEFKSCKSTSYRN